MILGRILTNFRNQNWASMTLEMLVLIVGVFAGLQADEWNAERENRNEERIYLQKIRVDVGASQDLLERYSTRVDHRTESLKILAVMEKSEALTIEDFNNAFSRGLYDLHFLPVQMTAYEDLKERGNIGLLTNDILRNKIADLYTDISSVRFDEADTGRFQHAYNDSFILTSTKLYQVDGKDFFGLGDDYKEKRVITKEIQQSDHFKNMVAFQVGILMGIKRSLESISSKYSDILGEVDGQLAKEGTQ